MTKWRVTVKIRLEKDIEADTREEAEEIANDTGDMHSDFVWLTDWKAKRLPKKISNQIS